MKQLWLDQVLSWYLPAANEENHAKAQVSEPTTSGIQL
jgi:hypothetical protein